MESGSQTETGKAFEYACAFSIQDEYQKRGATVELENSPQVETAARCFSYLDAFKKADYLKGARAAIRIIDRLEPMLSQVKDRLQLRLLADKEGMSGDVRDVVCSTDTWEIGLSCKHNHDAVKHSRLSDTIDFGMQWFGIPCSPDYFSEVCKVFTPLRKIRDESKANGHPVLWTELPDKEESIYVPILESFIGELRRLDQANPKTIPALLVKYLIGEKDFYKVITNDAKRYTQVESVNIHGSLNRSYNGKEPIINLPKMRLPTKFYEIGFKENTRNTIVIVCDEGWNFSMRIHNASSKVEPSLKFDVRLIAMPASIITQIEPWD